jgi:hypothetical protein
VQRRASPAGPDPDEGAAGRVLHFRQAAASL